MKKILLLILLFVTGGVCHAEDITIRYDADGKLIDTVTIPFSLRRSASLVTCPAFKVGETYTVKTKGYERTFQFSENFMAVR